MNQIGALPFGPTTSTGQYSLDLTLSFATQVHSVVTLFLSAQPTRRVSPSLGSDDYPPPVYPQALLLVSSDGSPQKTSKDSYLKTPISSLALRVGSRTSCWTNGRVLSMPRNSRFWLLMKRTSTRSCEFQIPFFSRTNRSGLLDLGFHGPHTHPHTPTETITENLSVQRNDDRC